MKKTASILDYSYPFLDPAVWDHDQKLHAYQKDFILRLLSKMYETYQFKQPEAWITDIRIIGSLTTSKWLFTSDMDVHMVVNLAKFIEINMPGADPKAAYEYLDSTRKEFDRAKILAPMTQHPIEYYFEVPEFITTNTSMVGVYSISKDAWLKEPVIFEADLDFEESKKQVMTQAESIAEALDGSFGKIDRQIDRITELENIIGAWDQNKQQLFYNKIEEKLKGIEAEILKNLELRQALIDTRHEAQDPMADIEIKFKWLQRFGFFGILTNLKNLMLETGGQVTLQELPLIKKIVTDSSLKEAFLKEAFQDEPKETDTDICVDFDRTLAKPAKHPAIGEPIEGAQESLAKLKDLGYNVVIYSCRGDTEEGIKAMEEWLDEHDMPYDSIFSGEKPFFKYLIDDRAIHFDSWDRVIEKVKKTASSSVLKIEPYGGGVEFPVLVNPSRMQVANALPQAGYGELRVIQGNNTYAWDASKATHEHVLEYLSGQGLEEYSNVQTGYVFGPDDIDEFSWGKRASLNITAVSINLQTIDPKTFKRTEPYALFIGTSNYGKAGLFDMFNVYGQHPMINEHNQLPTVGLDTLVKENIPIIGKEPRAGDKQPAQDISPLFRQASLSKKAYSSIGTNKFWITPDQKIIQIGQNEMHVDWIAHHLAQLAKLGVDVEDLDQPFSFYKGVYFDDLEDNDQATLEHIMNNMQLTGWTRITSDDARTQFTVDGGKLGFGSGVDQFIAEHFDPNDPKPIGAHWKGGEYLEISDPFPTLMQAYQKTSKGGRRRAAFSKLDLEAKTKKVKQGDYSCLMALVPHELAQEIVEWGVRNVPDEDLYLNEDGKFGRELEAHVTIKYGLLTNDAKYVRRSFNNDKPFHAKLGKVRHFEPPELPFDVLTIEVISEDLKKANKKVCDKFDCAEGLVSDEYKSHITIAYMKRGKATEYVGYEGFEGKEVDLDTIIFSPRKGNRTYFSISNDKESSFILEEITKFAAFSDSVWMDPQGKIYQIDSSHEDWALNNEDFLVKNYSIDWKSSYGTVDLLNNGWVRVGDIGVGETGFGIELKDLSQVPSFVFNYIFSNLTQDDLVAIADEKNRFIELPVKDLVNGQKDINRELFLNRAASLNKKAGYDVGYWVDPSGNIYNCHAEGLVHNEWILANLEMLKDNYGLKIPNYLMRESLEYFKAMETGEEDNFDQPSSDKVWDQMLKTGWARVGDADNGLGLEVLDIRKIPPHIDSLVGGDLHDGDWLRVDDITHNSVAIQYPFKNIQQSVNKALSSPTKTAEFLPSLFQAPDNRWQFEHGGDDKEIALNPDSVSDDQTAAEPCTTGKPRSKDVWRQFISIFRNPFSKKEDMTVDSAYDPKLEQEEKDALGEDQTLLEYSKGFYDPKKHDFPHNTTWDSLTQDGEPSKPTSVTYSPQISNEDNLDQNSPGGFPRRFMGKPKGEWFSDEGAIVPALENMWKYQTSAINRMTLDITAITKQYALYVNNVAYPAARTLTQWKAEKILKEKFPEAFASGNYEIKEEVYKTASIEKVDGITVFVNPTEHELLNYSHRLRGSSMFRGLIDPHTGDLFVWDAYLAVHLNMIPELGLDINYSEDSPYVLYFPPSSIYDALYQQKEVREGKVQKAAGSQSASVPDYLCDEWKTEQINNDTDEEPYVNHDQRDYPYGMHDSPENTGYNIGWPKDNQRAIVRLDTLENPAYRLDPFGIGEYNVTWYTSLPASDGIEKMNPE